MLIPWLVSLEIYFIQVSVHNFGVHGSDDAISNDAEISNAFTTCSKEWYGYGDKCYKLGGIKSNLRKSWQNAQKTCKDEYNGNLATVYSQDIQDFMTAFFVMKAQANVWIGLHDRESETDYKWADGSPYNFTYYQPTEPSGFARDFEDCMEMVFEKPGRKPGQWNDATCNLELPFICQKPKAKFGNMKSVMDPRYCTTDYGTGWRFEKSCFYVITESKSWSEAEQFCNEKVKGHLATIDYRVNEFLRYVLRNVSEEMWIGVQIKEEAQQKWSSGWLVSFENWEKQEDYVDGTCVSRKGEDSWKIRSCMKKLWFVCEYSTDTPPKLTPTVENAHCPQEPKGWRDFGGDLCYWLDLDTHITWYEASFSCKRRGGTLASIHSKEESDVLFQFVRYHTWNSVKYIGLYRSIILDEHFAWTDGSKVDFTYWGNGEPNTEKDKCTEINTRTMRWNDCHCRYPMGYICSVYKVIPNVTTEIQVESNCKNCISVSSLMGVIACVLVFSLLIGLLFYHFKLSDRAYEQLKKLSVVNIPPPELNTNSKYTSEIIVTDYTDYENLS